jgi:hypothetical protein
MKNIQCESGTHFMNKEEECVKGKIDELQTKQYGKKHLKLP